MVAAKIENRRVSAARAKAIWCIKFKGVKESVSPSNELIRRLWCKNMTVKGLDHLTVLQNSYPAFINIEVPVRTLHQDRQNFLRDLEQEIEFSMQVA